MACLSLSSPGNPKDIFGTNTPSITSIWHPLRGAAAYHMRIPFEVAEVRRSIDGEMILVMVFSVSLCKVVHFSRFYN